MKPIVADTDDRRWQAVCERDTRADGQFVFAVLTTGICCRPSCRSRRALRENVRFYSAVEAAIAAGEPVPAIAPLEALLRELDVELGERLARRAGKPHAQQSLVVAAQRRADACALGIMDKAALGCGTNGRE